MKAVAAAGFTLVEMLMAMAITAAVAVSAMAALEQLVDADVRTRQNIESTTGVYRALSTLRQDVTAARKLTVSTGECLAVQRDGTVLSYRVRGNGTELHRTIAANEAAVPAAPVDSLAPIGYTARGHMRDSDYRGDALVQGVAALKFVAIIGSRLGEVIGLKAMVDHGSSHGTQIACAIAVSMSLVEADAKP